MIKIHPVESVKSVVKNTHASWRTFVIC